MSLGMGSNQSALFHLVTHAYSKALLFLRSEFILHLMKTIVDILRLKARIWILSSSGPTSTTSNIGLNEGEVADRAAKPFSVPVPVPSDRNQHIMCQCEQATICQNLSWQCGSSDLDVCHHHWTAKPNFSWEKGSKLLS
ncbi:hypothetical protein HAX54_025873 [Datura stramonium]|uniref:Uncharacterized protein n=1 Tax=Datura stramonium TaxID=4076 RepID=A0ABS8V069_DATST|nr:hypothetical protein [Datura stramonium]